MDGVRPEPRAGGLLSIRHRAAPVPDNPSAGERGRLEQLMRGHRTADFTYPVGQALAFQKERGPGGIATTNQASEEPSRKALCQSRHIQTRLRPAWIEAV